MLGYFILIDLVCVQCILSEISHVKQCVIKPGIQTGQPIGCYCNLKIWSPAKSGKTFRTKSNNFKDDKNSFGRPFRA